MAGVDTAGAVVIVFVEGIPATAAEPAGSIKATGCTNLPAAAPDAAADAETGIPSACRALAMASPYLC
jgi:hypothetical protein